jgi:hypothetical protein
MRIDFIFVLAALMALCALAAAADENPFGSASTDSSSLRGDIYYLPEGASALPDFSSLTPVGSIYTRVLDIPERAFSSGFPGVTDRFEWFAIRYTGSFQAEVDGDYGFRLVSDDGSRLIIDGKKVIDNDGQHPPQSVSGSTYLSRGTHQIEVDYFQGPREYIALQLFWTPPGGSEAISNPAFVPGSSESGSSGSGTSTTAGTSTGTVSGATTGLEALDLTGVWDCDDGGTYYLRQSGDALWWFGEPAYEPGGWSNVAAGTISVSTIDLDWSDVPKGDTMNEGYLILDIVSNDRLEATEKTGGFGGSVWTRRTAGTPTGAGPGGISGPTGGMGGGLTAGSGIPSANPWQDQGVRSLIDEWLLQQDRCLKEVYGSGAYIDKWGRACGDLGTTTISCVLTPDNPLDWDNYQYLWFNNWCPDYYPHTVRDYVQSRQSGQSFEDLAYCKGEGEACY